MRKLSANTSHINNGFGDQNVGVMMGMAGMQFSGFYGANLFGTIRTYAPLVDNDTSVAFLVAHTDLNY